MTRDPEARFHDAWSGAGLGMGEAQVRANLLRRLAEPHRHYHTLAHVNSVLDELSFMEAELRHPAETALAAWFHDAVYDPRSVDNEAASAELAVTALSPAGLTPAAAQRIRSMIMDTTHNGAAGSPDGAALADADLAILGAPPDRFAAYDAAIRAEYHFVPEQEYRLRRAAVLERLLERASIYQTAPFRDHYEARARANLAGALASLRRPAD